MILLRLFMYILKPSNEWLRENANGTFRRTIIGLYQSILRCLLKSYRHYAISDTISLDCDRIKIIHEFRDLEFENELARNNIDVHPHKLSIDMPVSISKGKRKCCFKYFKWKNLKSIYIDNKELFIKHDDSLSINGNVLARIKSSSSEDIIIQSVIELNTIQKEQQFQIVDKHREIEHLYKNVKTKQPKNNLFRGDSVKNSDIQNNGEYLSKFEEKQIITKRGFEIDSTF